MGTPDTVCQVISVATVAKWGEPGQEVWVQIPTLPVFLTFFNSVPGILRNRAPPCLLAQLLDTETSCLQGTFYKPSRCLNLLFGFWSRAGALVSFASTWPHALAGRVMEEVSSGEGGQGGPLCSTCFTGLPQSDRKSVV